MARANSTSATRPSKPYSDFPLTPRGDGRWCKRINGKLHYFSGSWQEAIAEYQRVRDYLHAGKAPPIDPDAVTLRDVCNEFLTIKDHLVEAGEIKPRTFSDYKTACERILKTLGKNRLAGDIHPDDFANPARPERSSYAARSRCWATGGVPRKRRRRCAANGCAPTIWPVSTTRGT